MGGGAGSRDWSSSLTWDWSCCCVLCSIEVINPAGAISGGEPGCFFVVCLVKFKSGFSFRGGA